MTGQQTNNRYGVLFESVPIGPVTAKNRFYQVPHCTGMGWLRPNMLAALRETKAEGGWGVVCTEWCSVHPSSDDLPYPNAALWDHDDIDAHAMMTDRVHAYGALAGVELWLGGSRPQNQYSGEVGLDVASRVNDAGFPGQTRKMDRRDIRQVRQWHREAARRARDADFDIVYVYATHGYLLSHFLSSETNTRTDEYGGSLENRVRLLRELIEETREAVGDRCAVAVRFSANGQGEGIADTHESRDMLGLLGELPDLWDINIGDYSQEMGVSRFTSEGSLEPIMSYVKSVTSKPVVTVGRFTSPDTMLQQVKNGVTDFIGAARPSIADPFLPDKIQRGALEDIRECIGCNVCYTGDGLGVPIRCTQNPTISEGWRRGWHPEKYPVKQSDATVLVVGAGPAGLEATRVLGHRGYTVMLAERLRMTGGRIVDEAALPGLSAWRRVHDYRRQQIDAMPTVTVYPDNDISGADALAMGTDAVLFATGSHWVSNGIGRTNTRPFTQSEHTTFPILTPNDVFRGNLPEGTVVVFDDDHYYHASCIAEQLAVQGSEVIYVTTGSMVSQWSGYTAEQARVQKRLMNLGVSIHTALNIVGVENSGVITSCIYTGTQSRIEADSMVSVTSRQPNDGEYWAARHINDEREETQRTELIKIGDCNAPSIIASAVFAGHQFGREFEAAVVAAQRLERVRLSPEWREGMSKRS